MTITEMQKRVEEILGWLKYGEIRITIRNGEPKYVNTLQEYIPPKPGDRGKTDPEA